MTLSRLAARAWEYAYQRPLPDFPILLSFWCVWSGFYLWLAIHLDRGEETLPGATLLLGIVLCVVAFPGIGRLLKHGRLPQRVRMSCVVLVTIPLTGMVQFDECPHANYVQILGKSIAYKGYACGNPRQTKPWWMR